MAVTKLNANARPYHCSNRLRLSPLPPPSATPHHAAVVCPLPTPFVPSYPCAGPLPEYHYNPLPPPPPPLPLPYLCNCKQGGVPLASPSLRKHVPGWPPHGRRARALVFSKGAFVVEKLHAQALAKAQQQSRVRGRSRSKEYVPVAARAGGPARSPSPAFTTRPARPSPAPAWLGRRTTVMIRNIPNKLTRAEMMELLDDHCARENRQRGGRGHGDVLAAYDFLYVPMDFSSCSGQRSSNRGYAFVNFTTAAAAGGLHAALHGCRWKPSLGSKKIIHIDAAHIQGKKALVRHFSGATFACHGDELLPSVFSPPRDGAGAAGVPCSPAEPVRVVGRRVTPRAAAHRPPGSAAATDTELAS